VSKRIIFTATNPEVISSLSLAKTYPEKIILLSYKQKTHRHNLLSLDLVHRLKLLNFGQDTRSRKIRLLQ